LAFWSVIRVRRAPLAISFIGAMGFGVYYPRLRTRRIRFGRVVEVRPALFPAYMFVQIEQRWWSLQGAPGTRGLIMGDSGPAKVPNRVIDEIRRREIDGLIELPKRPPLERGDQVRVLRGPFIGRLGIYSDMRPRERVEVLLQLLGAEQRVELPRDSIEAV